MRRRVGGFLHPPADPPPERWTPGHAANPFTQNFVARMRFAERLEALANGDASAVEDLAAITARRPGLAPCGAIGAQREALTLAARAAPDDLTIRLALAEALASHGESVRARDLAIS